MTELHVVFGTGPMGRALAGELHANGHKVRLVNRSGRLDEAPAGAELVAADLYDPAQVRTVTQGAAVVYQAAQPAYHQWPEKFPALQAAIITGLTDTGAKLVLVENLYMYGETGGAPMTEATPQNAHTRKGRTRAAMSRAAFEAHQAGKLRVTAGRAADFFGPWALDSALGERVFYPLLAGKPANLVGNVDMPHTFTYTRDFARALVMLGARAAADGQAWHVPNASPRLTQRELVTLIAEVAGVEPKFSTMGKVMMALGGLFIPAARETVEMMYEFEQPFVVDSGAFERTFGLPATPLKEALRATVAWYRNHPEKHA